MIKRLERTLNGGLVYRASPGTGMTADTVVSSDSTVKKKMVATVRENQRKVGDKRSTQRTRAVSFDFGI